MNTINVITIGFALAMDAFAISVIDGSQLKKFHIYRILKPAIFFGVFQAIMPIIGWASGNTFNSYFKDYSKIISFLLLFGVAVKMIWEACKDNEINCAVCDNISTLIILSVATSIDALAVGMSFAFLNVNIILPSIVIGIITFLICVAGITIGFKSGAILQKQSALAGGVILIIIGIKILLFG